MATRKPKLAVWKFASCDGCQLTVLNCEDELIPLAGAVEIAYFPEATSAVVEGPYDVSLVEGSITTPDDLERIQQVREVSRRLITIGACATSGGIQALRNFADVAEFLDDRVQDFAEADDHADHQDGGHEHEFSGHDKTGFVFPQLLHHC